MTPGILPFSICRCVPEEPVELAFRRPRSAALPEDAINLCSDHGKVKATLAQATARGAP